MTRLDEREGRPGSADELGLPEDAPVYRTVGLSRDEVAELLTGRHVRRAEDGVWEVPIVLKSLRDAVETMVPVPLSHVNLNADLVGYVEEEAAEIPKKDPIRLVVLLPEAERAAADDGVLRALMRAYFRERLRRFRAEERQALRSVGAATFWGFVFMLGCQVVRWLANFPEHPTITSTISEGMLVLGWVALWNPYDRLLFTWWPALKKRRLVERLAGATLELRVLPFRLPD